MDINGITDIARYLTDEAAAQEGLGSDAFGFLPRLKFFPVEFSTNWLRPFVAKLRRTYEASPVLFDEDPFEVDAQAAHLFKHPHLGLHDVYDVWTNDPLFYPAKPPAHWLMCAEVAGRVLVVPLAPARDGDPHRCRPIGCYEAAPGHADQYRRDR